MIPGSIYGGIVINPSSVCFLFGPINPLEGYIVKCGCIDEG